MRILIAPDKFKGSLTAVQAGEAIARGLRRGGFTGDVEFCPIADGGEGFTAAVCSVTGGTWREVVVPDAQGRRATARYCMVDRGDHLEAAMEMSAASGLAMVSDLPLDPRSASTRGTGEMMLDAARHGARRILIGIGGSATNDGGCGMAAALGVRFLDASGNVVPDLPAGLDRVARIERGPALAFETMVACDVANPLLGDEGATRIYGPQKGVTDLAFFETRLRRLADLVARDLGCDHRDVPGAGAAGGLGFGLMSFCGAQLRSGFELVADISGLRELMARADVVITGEGRLDGQTLHGKGPAGVAELARSAGRRVVGVGGLVEPHDKLKELFDALWQAKPGDMAMADAVARAGQLLEDCVARNVASLSNLGLGRK